MKTLLVMTVGQTDVQLVTQDGKRQKLSGKICGKMHDQIKGRNDWLVTESPSNRVDSFCSELPAGKFNLCTPKLDAILRNKNAEGLTSALILETTRGFDDDPRYAGAIIEKRLRALGLNQITRIAFLKDDEKLECPSNDVDAVIRQDVVNLLSGAIGRHVDNLPGGDGILVATTGGLAVANELICELVRFHSVGGPKVTCLEIPDGSRVSLDDRAMEEKFHPAAGYRARGNALSLIEGGNLNGAWGAVSHLHGQTGQDWTHVIGALSSFSSSLPMAELPGGGRIMALEIPSVARVALRVELALRAGDIPKAVQGTVAFFEAALWAHLEKKTIRHDSNKRLFRFREGHFPAINLFRERVKGLEVRSNRDIEDDRKNPFIFEKSDLGHDWYRIDDSKVCAVRIAEHYLENKPLTSLGKAVSDGPRELRNDASHNEPTPDLMAQAQKMMADLGLWSNRNTFLNQEMVSKVLEGIGVGNPEGLCRRLLVEVRALLGASWPQHRKHFITSLETHPPAN